MIIKRPYAFFIKNFKKIHIVLLLLGLVVLFHQSRVYGFIKEFLDLQTYDPNNFPITKYIPTYLLLLVLIMAVGCLIITIVLKRKSKPWKLYLIPTIAYFLLLFMYVIIRGYFKTYTGAETTAEMSLYRDILLFASVAQYPSFAIFLVRIFGLDLRKFNFKSDTEYLELEEEDQQEIEININVDKESFRRGFYRLIRNLKYIYQEHKKTCLFIVAIISVILLRELYFLLFVNNKTYKQNQEYNVNGYTFVVKNVYYTDKNFNGDVISKKNAFVIVDLNVKNNAVIRGLDTEKFHLLNGVSNYTDTAQTYSSEFDDLGKIYDNKDIAEGESIDIILVFRVDKNLDKDRFVLLYQETEGAIKLRKIKLKVTNLSNIDDHDKMKLGDSMKVKINNIDETISVDDYYLKDRVTYKYRVCVTNECENKAEEFVAPSGKIIMMIEYGTEEIESKELIDFSTNYGKIIYIDSKGKKVVIPMKNALERHNKGKNFYTLVPSEIEEASKIYIEYTVRNNKYVYGG